MKKLIAFEAIGWRWRFGPSFCASFPFYVGHVLKTGWRPQAIIPCTGDTPVACLEKMVAAIEREETPA